MPSPTMLRPTPQQLAWQKSGLGIFFHLGINTFAGKEWSDGTLPATDFDPTDLDADEWVRAARDLGAAYVILTAKHHDGFCLWPTATTDYSVASSPWKDGKGDVVAEVAAACRRHGLQLGLYLSPWDRNADCYEDAERYDEFYLAQLRELCTNYGELVKLWFDGAGSAGREYAWDRIGELIDELQPGAMVFNMGPATIRWIGNEDGLAADPCEYVTDSTDLNNYDEDVVTGRRVRAHRVLAADGTVLAEGGTIGVRRIHRLPGAVEAGMLRIEVEGQEPVLEAVIVHDATGAPVPALPQDYRAPTEAPTD